MHARLFDISLSADSADNTGGTGIYVEPAVAQKTDQRHISVPCEVDSETGGGPDRCQHGASGHTRFLYQFETCSAAHQQTMLLQWYPAAHEQSANEFIHCVVPAHVFINR